MSFILFSLIRNHAHWPRCSLWINSASVRIFKWWLTVGWLRSTGAVRSQAHACPLRAIIDRSCSLAGCATAFKIGANRSASGFPIGERSPSEQQSLTSCSPRRDSFTGLLVTCTHFPFQFYIDKCQYVLYLAYW